MKLLVLGGTVFLGRAVVEAALARGDEVTIFHRGHHNLGVFGPEVDERLGDRRKSLRELQHEGDVWDVVVDTSGYDPADVARSARMLSGRVKRYVFVSSLSAYRGWPAHGHPTETWPEGTAGYGGLKAACERAAEAAMPGRVLSVRSGVLVGPREHVGRLPYWLDRIARGGYVLAPGPPEVTVQLLDARDLGAWLPLARPAGAVDAVGPRTTWGELLGECMRLAGANAELVWVDGEQLAARVADPWQALPLWPPPGAQTAGLYAIEDGSGLACRALRATVEDTWHWLRNGGPDEGAWWRVDTRVTPLEPDVERSLLAALGGPELQRRSASGD